jgi:alpha-beta hydrolase superfamily lysophospholipase
MTSIEEMKQGISHQEGFFDGVRGAQTYYQCWLPDGESKAVLFIVHGLAEHSGRYMHIVNHFVPLGYAVYGHDCFGHGKSAGTRVFVEQFEDITKPLEKYFDMVRAFQPGRPIVLLGHSLGGLISSRHLLDHQSNYVGAILSGPSIRVVDHPSPFLLFILNLVSAIVPKLGVKQLESDVMSTDPKEVEGYVSDPLVHPGKVTAGMLAAMFTAIKHVTDHASQITLPLLIVQGGADATVDPAGAQLLYDTVGSSDKTIKVYEDYYHEVFNEPESRRNQVFNDIQDWLENRL